MDPGVRTGRFVQVILFYDAGDPFFKEKMGVGLLNFGVEGRAGKQMKFSCSLI